MRYIVAAILILFSVPAHAEWWEAETAHFIVKSRASEADAREYALEMEKFDAVLRTLQGMPTDHVEDSRANKPTIYRFGRPKDIARVAGASGSGIAGFFISRAGESVAFAPTRSSRDTSAKTSWAVRGDPRARLDPRSVLMHEYTHYFMMQHFPGAYPRWYVEGFAETLATIRMEEDGSYHIGDPPQYRAFQVFQLNDFPMDEMLDAEHKLTGLDGLQHYATGWLLTHYMSFDNTRLPQLRAYLKALAEGEDSLTVAKREFGDLNQLEKELRSYKKGPFPGLRISTIEFSDEVKMRALTKIEESAIQEEMLLARGYLDEDEGRDVAGDVRGLISRHGENPHLLSLLAQAQFAAEDYAGADATATRLLELDQDNTNGWLVRTYAALELAKDTPELAEKAREYATQAADSDRYDPRPLIAYYYSYVDLDETPPETAIIALEQAFKTAGSDTPYRLLLARQLLTENRMNSARAVLLPIAFAGHKTAEPKDEEDPSLSRLLKLVLDEDRDAALTMIDKMMDEEEDEADAVVSATQH